MLESYRESVLELGVVTGMIVIFTGGASEWSYTACNDSDGNLYGESVKSVPVAFWCVSAENISV